MEKNVKQKSVSVKQTEQPKEETFVEEIPKSLSIIAPLQSSATLRRERAYMPRFSIFYPIQNASGNGKPWYVYLGTGTEEENVFLTEPYILTCLGVRRAVRVKTSPAEYLRAFPDPHSESGKKKLAEVEKLVSEDNPLESGYIALEAILIGDGNEDLSCSICTQELYRTNLSYFSDLLSSCSVQEKKMARINILNHAKNVVKSKNNPKQTFLGSFSPDDYEIEKIGPETFSLIMAAVEGNKEKIEKFLNE